MKKVRVLIAIALMAVACQKSGSNDGGSDPVPGPGPGPGPVDPTSFTFEDGTVRSLAEMTADADCAALLPQIRTSHELNPGRGIRITVSEENSGTDRTFYCWNPKN
jgi:hypothetical protein